MDHDLDENESLRARVKQLEHERNELQKDIEQLCMQQAGPSILGVATRMHFQRTASLEQEIESLKMKLANCTREKHNLQEELTEAYRVKAQLADLHAGEVAKNLEAEKQVRFFQGSVAAAFSERDKSVMEAEKAKEKAERMSEKLGEIEMRLEELSSDCLVQKRLNDTLQADVAKLEEQTKVFAGVIEKFYDIRKASLCESLEVNLHDKCASLLDDPKESWTFNDPSTSEYVAALEGELGKLKNTLENLKSKLRVGLEIENHLKKRVHALEKKNIVADGMIVNGIADLRHHHSELRDYIINLLNEEGLYIKSIFKDLEERLKLRPSELHNVVLVPPLQHDLKPDESECRDVHITTAVDSCQVIKHEDPSFSKITAESRADASEALAQALQEKLEEPIFTKIRPESRADASEAFAQALQEKVGALLLLSQQEERYLHEENINAALQRKVDELQRNVLQVTNEKVRNLMELARLRQEYQSLKDKMSGTRDGEITEKSGRIVMSNEKEGRLKNMWKKSYINRWIDSSSREGGSHSNTEADYAGNIDYARMKVEYAALKESLESMGHLTTSIRRLRLALLKVKEMNDTETSARSCEVAISNILVEATHLKTALGISIPISWSAESDSESVTDGESSCDKTDSVSAAGFEMVELVILAAEIMKVQHN
ncbi:myosin heavy chain-related [Raphanus sativus]|uniref:Spindle pole body protein pcp1 isoform X1 n=1 Tax=Raphanus sativus TaxID=3726 RepID=A0A6J0LP35_RAPSA|nr:spindle pole body protein pcp1 isoform X1 [Raphanus sativus]XP_018461560.1 spindle pole body protein pcp1 isoform X1 [Raphanus sativus]KAJ4889372.1 myosin heavy chain-related [Raphanus sativus]